MAAPWIRSTPNAFGRTMLEGILLDAAVATTDGIWVGVDGRYPFTIGVEGITTATAKVHVSNLPTKPLNSSAGSSPFTGDTKTADGIWLIDFPVRWVKVSVTAWTTGTLNAYLMGYA